MLSKEKLELARELLDSLKPETDLIASDGAGNLVGFSKEGILELVDAVEMLTEALKGYTEADDDPDGAPITWAASEALAKVYGEEVSDGKMMDMAAKQAGATRTDVGTYSVHIPDQATAPVCTAIGAAPEVKSE